MICKPFFSIARETFLFNNTFSGKIVFKVDHSVNSVQAVERERENIYKINDKVVPVDVHSLQEVARLNRYKSNFLNMK